MRPSRAKPALWHVERTGDGAEGCDAGPMVRIREVDLGQGENSMGIANTHELLMIAGRPPSASKRLRDRLKVAKLPTLPHVSTDKLEKNKWVANRFIEDGYYYQTHICWSPQAVYVGPDAARKVGLA